MSSKIKRWLDILPDLGALLFTIFLVATVLLLGTVSAHAVTQQVTKTHYRLDTGVIFIWGNLPYAGAPISEAAWQNELGIGGTASISLSAYIGSDMTNVSAYPYTPGKIPWEEIEKNRKWNHETEAQYKSTYYNQGSNSITGIHTQYNGTTARISYSAKVDARGKMLDVKRMLEAGQYDYLKQLCGTIPPEQEKIIKQVQAGTFGENIVGFCVFTPMIIQYDSVEEVEVEPPLSLTASLALPKTAPIGETYVAKDATILPTGAQLKSTKLEKKNEAGNWISVTGWDGSKLGSSIDQSADQEGDVTYRLTVTAKTGESATDEKTITIVDGRNIEGKATLSLPPYTYEGHPVTAEDESRFTVDGEIYGATRAYAEGIATGNKFEVVESGSGALRKVGKTQAQITFPRKGNYHVSLEVQMKDGMELTDQKPIEVRKTPTVIASLTGRQKENRKQILNIKAATKPDQPLTELWAEIEEVDEEGNAVEGSDSGGGTEKVHLVHHVNGTENSLENSDEIKTRPLELLPSDEYFTNLKLEFLTKNPVKKNYRYTVYAKDKKGDTDQVSQTFAVEPDLPPEAKIIMDDQFIREPGTNTARIETEDGSSTDGDQLQRTWSVALAGNGVSMGAFVADLTDFRSANLMKGFTDMSFGSGKRIGFEKDHVGAFAVCLNVKDEWVDETLPEYITEADYLTASAVRTSEVINIAPIVSIEPLASRSAEILLLAGGDEEYEILNSTRKQMTEKLLQAGVDGSLTIRKLTQNAENVSSGVGGVKEGTVIREPFAYQGEWTFLKDAFLVDEENLYTVTGTWTGGSMTDYPGYPYYVNAYDGGTGEVKWTYTINQETMNINTGTDTRLLQDDWGKYLFLRSGGKTLMIQKDTGTFLTVLNTALGNYNFLGNNSIYSFKTDGIYRISTTDGMAKKLYTAGIYGTPGRYEGKITFISSTGNSVYRSTFDPQTEKVRLEQLPGTEKDVPGAQYALLAADTDGKLAVRDPGSIRVYNRENELIKTLPAGENAAPIIDEAGRCDYIVYTSHNSGSKTSSVFWNLRGITDDTNLSASTKSSDGYTTHYDRIEFARRIGSKVYVGTTGDWAWIPSWGYHYNDSMFQTCTFDLNAQKASVRNGGLGGDITVEEIESSDALGALHTGDNKIEETVADGSMTRLMSWNQNIDQILSRFIAQGLSSEKDLRAVVVYDNTNTAMETPMSLSELRIGNERQAKLVYASDLAYERGYGARLTAALNSVLNGRGTILPQNSSVAAGAAERILEKEGSEQNTLMLQAEGSGEAALSRTFQAIPGTTYYYEYDIKAAGSPENASGSTAALKDLFQIQYHFQQIPSNLSGESEPKQYQVTESYYEDFQDPYLNSFFTLVPGKVKQGWYAGVDFSTASKDKKDRVRSGSDTIRFTVPEGKRAVLSFDFDQRHNNEQNTGSNNILIDGVNWKQFGGTRSNTGHYTHKELLGPGEHTIQLIATEYIYLPASLWTKIDNLRVDFVEPATVASGITTGGGNGPITPGSGWKKVSGSFTAPGQAAAYSQQETEHINGGFTEADPIIHFVRNKTNRYGTVEWYGALNIPEGKNAVLGSINTGTTIWSDNGLGAVGYYAAGRVWNCGVALYSRSQYLAPGSQTLFLPALPSGSSNDVHFKTSLGYDSRNYASVGAADLWLTGELNQSLRENRFFIDQETEQIFAESELFAGDCTLRFEFPGRDRYQLKDLKIYTMVDGRRVYLEQESAEQLEQWEQEGLTSVLVPDTFEEEKEEDRLVYRKGELVTYSISYSDYEKDPSKKQHWRYLHTPFNDGPHPDAAVILDDLGQPTAMPGTVLATSIPRFYIDGKYTVEHWQEDNTSRPSNRSGNPDYDKKSNVASLTFYIEGTANAPWVTYIKTKPTKVKEGDRYQLEIGVDDLEKDMLSLTTELYQGKNLIYTHRATSLSAIDGKYAPVITETIPKPAEAGNYQVVCTVRDWSGAGLGTYKFTVVSEGKITGWVYHTDQWDQNRKKYNQKKFKTEFNKAVEYSSYKGQKAPRKRGTNVFWSGEKFVLQAAVAGNPTKVTCQIQGTSYSTKMKNTGMKNPAGEALYTGSLWDSKMINKWGRKTPEQLIFHFTAYYSGGTTKTYNVPVIVDTWEDYWKLHRYF